MIRMFLLMILICLLPFGIKAGELETLVRDQGCSITNVDVFCGFKRLVFDFEGEPAWIVLPHVSHEGRRWVWVMKWPGADAAETGQIDALSRGYHYVHLEDWKYWMNDKGLKRAKRFYDLLTLKLGFLPKSNLMGWSWGGFYAVRFAATYPECVDKIYLDCPLLTFGRYKPWTVNVVPQNAWPYAFMKCWQDDGRMPINCATPIANAKIPILLLYGGRDEVVDPEENAETFAKRFVGAGGELTIQKRVDLGHRPRGYINPDEQHKIIDFFER